MKATWYKINLTVTVKSDNIFASPVEVQQILMNFAVTESDSRYYNFTDISLRPLSPAGNIEGIKKHILLVS